MPVVTVSVTAPLPEPEAGERVIHGALLLADQVSVPLPVLLMLSVWAAGLTSPFVAVKVRLVRLAPIAGFTDSVGAEGGEINCANPGISATNLCIVRPPPPRFSEVDELAVPGVAIDPVAVADDGATLRVARGATEERLPVFLKEVSLGEVEVSG